MFAGFSPPILWSSLSLMMNHEAMKIQNGRQVSTSIVEKKKQGIGGSYSRVCVWMVNVWECTVDGQLPSHWWSPMRPETGYYRPVYTTDTDSTQRGNSCCSPGKLAEERRSYTKLLSVTASPSWNVITYSARLCRRERRDTNSPELVF